MLKGSFVALITPFTDTGEVDFEALEKLLEWHLEEKTQGLILCGSTGEDATLSEEEKCAIFALGVKVLKEKITLIAYSGSNDTKKTVQLTKKAKSIGVDGSIIIIPYCNRPTEEGCFEHFKEIATVGLPMILYHHPGRSGIKLSAKGLLNICSIPQVVGVKDCSEDFSLANELAQNCTKSLFSGDDNLALAHLACGFNGVISVVGNIVPRKWREFVHLALNDNISEARQRFSELYPLCKAMTLETNPQCVKYAAHLLGKCSSKMRLPLIEPRLETRKKIEEALEQFAGLLN